VLTSSLTEKPPRRYPATGGWLGASECPSMGGTTRPPRLRVTVAGRDAADLVPIDQAPSWTSGRRAHELITGAQADPGLTAELAEAFPDATDEI